MSGPLIAHDFPTLLGAALEGLGLAQVPEPSPRALAAGQTGAVLERYRADGPGMFLYHPGKRQVLPKLRAFIDHVKSRSARRTRIEADERGTRRRK